MVQLYQKQIKVKLPSKKLIELNNDNTANIGRNDINHNLILKQEQKWLGIDLQLKEMLWMW